MLKSFNQLDKAGKKKAAIYIRVSTDKQAKEGLGKEIQEEICRDTCDLKNLEVYGVYIDEGVSGTTKPFDRDGMGRLMNDANDKKFDSIVFHRLDRVAREITITFDIIRYFTDRDIQCISCIENFDNTTYQGKFKLSIYATIAELELNTIRERVALGRYMRFIQDGDKGGVLPYGYMRSDEGIVINKDEAKIIQDIFYAYYMKKFTAYRIAKLLNESEDKKSKESTETEFKKKEWYEYTIRCILSHKEKYEGGIINDNPNNVRWPVILSYRYTRK